MDRYISSLFIDDVTLGSVALDFSAAQMFAARGESSVAPMPEEPVKPAPDAGMKREDPPRSRLFSSTTREAKPTSD